MTTFYYVYTHFDPDTKEILYVGMGSNDRAYRMLSGQGKKYSDRHPDHHKYLDSLYNKGYLPHEWVSIEENLLTKEKAFDIERKLIKELNPIFNRKYGPVKILTDDQVNKIKKLHDQKYSYDKIGEIFNCSRSTVYRVIRKKRGTYC